MLYYCLDAVFEEWASESWEMLRGKNEDVEGNGPEIRDWVGDPLSY